MLKKPQSDAAAGADASGLASDPQWAETYPLLWSYLTQVAWEDGSSRETSSLLVFFQDGLFKVMLKDKALGRCLWAATRQPSCVWELLETLLQDPATEWRADRQPNSSQPARRLKGKS